LKNECTADSALENRVLSDPGNTHIEYLIIPNTNTAKNQLLTLSKTEKINLSLSWRGGKKINDSWAHSHTPYYSVKKEQKENLLKTLSNIGIPSNEIEFREIIVNNNLSKKMNQITKIISKGKEFDESLKMIKFKETKEIEISKKLFEKGLISAIDYIDQKKHIKERYSKEIEFLSNHAVRNYRSALEIHNSEENNVGFQNTFIIEQGKTHIAAEQAVKILSNHECGVFQRIGKTVRIIKYLTKPKKEKTMITRQDGSFFITEADEAFLIKLLSKKARWLKLDKRTKKHELIDFPEKAARFILSDRGANLPVLTGFVCSPTLREDGSILDIPGYDEISGLFFDPCGTSFPPILQSPSREDAERSLELLKNLLIDFSFDGDISLSVAISELMTGIIRRSIAYSPAFGNNAPEAGSGKSLLGDIASIIATGNCSTSISPSQSEEENRKRLASALLGGDLVVCIDNVQDPFESESMCTILTSKNWKERLLGTNVNVHIPTNSLFIFTGNNLTFKGDLCSRIVMCNIDPRIERPGERFFNRDLREYASKHRGELVVAIITIIKAYISAGLPDQNLVPFRLFSQWTKWIRSPLVWLGMRDPYESTKIITNEDPIRDEIGSLFSCWEESIKKPLSVKDLLNIVNDEIIRKNNNQIFNLYEQLIEFAGEGKPSISSEKLGKKLRKYKGRIVSGYRLEATGKDRRGAATWLVSKI